MNKYIDKFIVMAYGKVAIIALLAGLFYWYAYFDMGTALDNQLSTTQQKIKDAEKKKKEVDELIQRQTDLENKAKDMVQNIENLQKSVPTEIRHQDLIIFVQNTATQANVKVLESKKGLKKTTGAFEKLDLDIVLEGTFANLMLFNRYVAEADKAMKIEDLSFYRVLDNRISSPIRLKGRLVAYRQLSSAEAAGQ